jgi:hypothetical protein
MAKIVPALLILSLSDDYRNHHTRLKANIGATHAVSIPETFACSTSVECFENIWKLDNSVLRYSERGTYTAIPILKLLSF